MMALGIILATIFVEAAIRVSEKRLPKYVPHPYLSYYLTPNYISSDKENMHNSLGFRGPEILMPKPENTFRIVILGGSSAYETGIKNWKKDSARALEKYLNEKENHEKKIEVINGGVGGWNSWEDLISFEFRVLDLNPDMILVYQGVNDVHSRLVNPSSYKGDNSGRRSIWEKKPCNLLCLRIVQIIAGTEPESIPADASTYSPSPVDEFNPILGMTPSQALEKNQPIYYERNLKNLIAIAKENNVKVLISTWAYSEGMGDYIDSPPYKKGVLELNELMKKIAQSEKVDIYDLANDFPKDTRYWVDGRHNNEAGADQKASLWAKYILDKGLIN